MIEREIAELGRAQQRGSAPSHDIVPEVRSIYLFGLQILL
jgi:hypothetical protein